MAAVTVDVQVACDERGIPSDADIQSWVGAAVEQSGRPVGDNVEVAVRIVGAEEIQTLNGLYREQDKTTNVLSFPAGAVDGLPDDAGRHLGDIVVCASVVATEADDQGQELADHWNHMLVHGTLHLLGFDHETDAEAAEMEGLESKILASQNVTDPQAES
jgi:probable rRNA maturation factor